jgi:LPXTG-site transpeptidase (sortase) family protein
MQLIPSQNRKNLSKSFFFFIALTLLISIPTQVFALTTFWNTPVTADNVGSVGQYISLAVINGNPAMSYFDETNQDLKYVRATDASGTSWGTPLTLDSAGVVGQNTFLSVVNGNSAISYLDYNNGDLKYVRATDADGTAWGTPLTVDAAGWVGPYACLVVVNGNPAISYLDVTNQDVKYVRATDASGSAWGTPITVDSTGDVGLYISMALVNGSPAISYYDAGIGDLKYVRATDASGSAWGTPLTLDSAGDVGIFTSLAVVNGSPAISYFDDSNTSLKYVRAADASGTAWGSPLTLDNTAFVGTHTSLEVINGSPAVSYYDWTNGSLKYVAANDASGSSWSTPATVDTAGNVGHYSSLASVNGHSAIAYYDVDNTSVKFIISSGTIDISVWESGTQINPSDTFDFGSVVVGSPNTITFTIQNNGTEALELAEFILATGYNLSGTYPHSIAAGGSADIHIRLDALQTGSFSGDLRIASTDTALSPFIIHLTGQVTAANPEIAVFEGVSEITSGSGSVAYGSTLTGTPMEHIFTIQNNGAYNLNLFSLSLPAGFSLAGSYASTVAPGDSTNITVRLDALTAGSFAGNFSLANNDTSENPFLFAVSGSVSEAPGEIAILEGINPVVDGTGSVDFGSTLVGTPVSRTFTVQNSGTYALDLGTLSLPGGFSLVGSYPSSVASGDSTSITVQLDALSAGTYSGTFSLPNDDLDENPYTFALTGTVSNLTLRTPLIAPVSGSTVLQSNILVAFNQPVLSDGSADAANNPANYLLVEAGADNAFETTTCSLGLAGDDVPVTIGSVTYDSSNYIATVNTGTLPSGQYQLLVCGTASIEGLSGNVLNNGLLDSSSVFTIVSASSSGGSSTGSGSSSVILPSTGFAPGQVTLLPSQPLEAAYSDMNTLRLQIPSLKVDVPIVGVPQTSKGWDVTWLGTAEVGWLNGTAFPTWEGNTVLTGHVTDASGNLGPFAQLKTLKYGDEIVLQAYGETHRYQVQENKLVVPANTQVITEHKDQSWITLITCEYYYEETGEYLYRRVIRAALVEVE